jgi:release factor glutamine methyltransferase
VRQRWHALLARYIAGEPLAYLTGIQPFMRFNLKTTPAAAIPRPLTEAWLAAAIDYLKRQQLVTARSWLVDVGTGTGAIALSLARAFPRAKVVALEKDSATLNLARRNFSRYPSANLKLVKSDLLAALPKSPPPSRLFWFANLPYLPTRAYLENPSLRFEPRAALEGGRDGRKVLRAFFAQLTERTALRVKTVFICCEHAPTQKTWVVRRLRELFPALQPCSFPDVRPEMVTAYGLRN